MSAKAGQYVQVTNLPKIVNKYHPEILGQHGLVLSEDTANQIKVSLERGYDLQDHTYIVHLYPNQYRIVG